MLAKWWFSLICGRLNSFFSAFHFHYPACDVLSPARVNSFCLRCLNTKETPPSSYFTDESYLSSLSSEDSKPKWLKILSISLNLHLRTGRSLCSALHLRLPGPLLYCVLLLCPLILRASFPPGSPNFPLGPRFIHNLLPCFYLYSHPEARAVELCFSLVSCCTCARRMA